MCYLGLVNRFANSAHAAMARRRLAEAEAVNAEIMLTECNSCVHNLSNAKLRKQKLKIYNLSQFISELIQAK